jgi:oligoendopeptidase F
MQKKAVKKILSILLALLFVLSSSATLVGCSMYGGSDPSGDDLWNGDENSKGDPSDVKPGDDYHDKLIVPAYKEYDRRAINFDDITYVRPNYDSTISAIENVTGIIKANSVSFEDQIKEIEALEDPYEQILTMYSLANIINAKDATAWSDEFAYVTSNYPKFAKALEDMFVAAANSPHAERFEEEYFGNDLIEEYKDGGIYTENMVNLWADEESLESKYSSLSTATVKITYMDTTDTVDNILKLYLKKYGINSTEYVRAEAFCMSEYEKATEDISKSILVDLFKVRKLIANELGHSSYAEYGYESLGRNYSAEKASDLLTSISANVLPVYLRLSEEVFSSYFKTNTPNKVKLDTLINNGYKIVENMDESLLDVYSYMLQYELFDIELTAVNRQGGAFTSYLDSYDSPFIFMSADGYISDYSTLMHEFGHFADGFINYGEDASIDRQEISSQALELLSLCYMDNILDESDIKYLQYSSMYSALETLLFQGFYARFEELAYAIPYDQISEQTLNSAVVMAAYEFGLNTAYVNDITVAFIPHIFLYPFYVQSYCTSIIPALQFYFMEIDEAGSGIEAYKAYIDRNETDYDFEESLENAGLTSPFAENTVQEIVAKIYYEITGSRYSPDGVGNRNSAA